MNKKLTPAQQNALNFIDRRIITKGSCHRHAPAAFGNVKLVTLRKLEVLGLITYEGQEIVLTDAALDYLPGIE